MISNISDSLNKTFILCFLIPATFFIFTNIVIILFFEPDIMSTSLTFFNFDKLHIGWMISFFSILGLFLALILFILKNILTRLLAGYYLFNNPLFKRYQKWRFDRFCHKIESLRETRDIEVTKNVGDKKFEEARILYRKIYSERYIYFPCNADTIKGTTFGNVVRSFMNYPFRVYGISAAAVWPRLITFVPKDVLERVENAEARVDLEVNCIYLLSIFIITWGAYITFSSKLSLIWILLAAILSMIGLYKLLVKDAIIWGNYVKSVFDNFRNDLLKQYNIEIPENLEEERKIWKKLNQRFLYWVSE